MIPALLASVGVPLLGKLVSSGLRAIDDPTAKAAADALDDVGSKLDRGEIDRDQLQIANRHVERMAAIEARRDARILAQINRTMRTEASSADPYVRRWRPTFGYAVALAWIAQTGALTYAIVMTPAVAAELLAATTHLSVIWGVALSVLGINVAKRSQDKRIAAGQLSEPGLLDRLLQPFGGRKE
ncbi:3TM-type holin [Rhodovibrio salinarum]|uniref:Ribokinase n=1 Tax=Rhodovibrio salinarum TaxID=1087 RepID=A0A934QN85_9PROT|nr:3TM-type holin [Rhodovibrio salinarum]MBK1699255.1 ribokinase [Rhodovibrio salinarum]